MSRARDRLLDTASRLFYAEGVRAVGIDRIIAEASVAKATFYHHFRTKDELVLAYLDREYARQRDLLAAVPGNGPERIAVVFARLAELGCAPGFRGCPFLNAAAEYADPAHPVRRVVTDYRAWFRDHMRALLRDRDDAGPLSDYLLLLRDGMAISGGLEDQETVQAGLRTLDRLLAA